MVENLLVYLSALVLTSLLIYSRLVYGMTRSISAIYYKLKQNQKWIFTATLCGLALPLVASAAISAIQAGTANAVWSSVLIAMSGTAICFTGFAGDARSDEIIEKVHVIGATGGMFLAGAGLLFTSAWFLVVPMALISGFLYWKKVKNHTYWIELNCFTWVLIGLIMI